MPGKKNKSVKIKWEEPACDNCGSKKHKVFLDNVTTWEHFYKFREVKCEKCGLVYLSPRPKKEYISKFYPPKTYWGTDLSLDDYISSDLKKRSLIFGRVYKNILNRKGKSFIFDVGFGTGLFLSYFNELDWEVCGIELSKDVAKYAKSNFGLNNLKSGRIEEMKVKKNEFDVVTFNSSLEHLYSPKKALKKAFEMLKKNGLLVVTVPNLKSLGFSIFGKRWLGLHPPKHLYHFSAETLGTLLENQKFEIEKVDHWFWNHSFYSFFESFRYMISPRFKSNASENILSNTKSENAYKNNIFKTIFKKLGILFVTIFASTLSIIGSLIKRGEVITVYARKS